MIVCFLFEKGRDTMKKVSEIRTIGDNKYHYTHGYFVDNKWIDNDTLIIKRSENPTIACSEWKGETICELVKLSLKDNSMEVICRDKIFDYFYFVYDNKIYYSDRKCLKVVDIDTKKIEVFYENDYYPDLMTVMSPSLTNDGKYVCIYIAGDAVPQKSVVLERETGKIIYSFVTQKFSKPFDQVSHVMICPENYKLVYFCHEGTTQYVSNRMWLYDSESDKQWNFAKQRLDEDGNLGDCFGHEMWAPDGKGMYFVKYPASTIEPSGVCYVDVKTQKVEVLYTKYKYWHIGVSSDGKYLAGDTFEPDISDKSKSEVVFIDLAEKSELMIDIAHKENHPAHPHPIISPNADKVVYNSLDENNRVVLKIAFLED